MTASIYYKQWSRSAAFCNRLDLSIIRRAPACVRTLMLLRSLTNSLTLANNRPRTISIAFITESACHSTGTSLKKMFCITHDPKPRASIISLPPKTASQKPHHSALNAVGMPGCPPRVGSARCTALMLLKHSRVSIRFFRNKRC